MAQDSVQTLVPEQRHCIQDVPGAVLARAICLACGSDVNGLLASGVAGVSRAFLEASRAAVALCERLNCQSHSMKQLIGKGRDDRLRRLLQKTRALRRLSLHSTGVKRLALATAVQQNPGLEVLDLGFSYNLSPDDIQDVAWNLPHLQELSLQSSNEAVGDGACLVPILKQSPRLKSLNLSWCREFDNKIMPQGLLSRLRHLNVLGCERVDDSICGQLQNVTTLNLAFCPISDSGLSLLAHRSTKLQSLVLADKAGNLWSCGNWTTSGLATFRSINPRVHITLASS